MKTMYVYILKCSDSSYYTGVTNNLEKRFNEHELGVDKECYTFSRRPLEIAFYQIFNDPRQAIAFEKQIKGWNRKRKEAIINDNWEKLKELAFCRNNTSHIYLEK